jgi:hypothetical protein
VPVRHAPIAAITNPRGTRYLLQQQPRGVTGAIANADEAHSRRFYKSVGNHSERATMMSILASRRTAAVADRASFPTGLQVEQVFINKIVDVARAPIARAGFAASPARGYLPCIRFRRAPRSRSPADSSLSARRHVLATSRSRISVRCLGQPYSRASKTFNSLRPLSATAEHVLHLVRALISSSLTGF